MTVDPDAPIGDAIALMRKHRVSGLPVVNRSGQLVGILSEFDLLDLIWDHERGSSEVYQYMTREVHTVDEEDDLASIAEQFRMLGLRRLPVMRGQQLVGILSRHDLLGHLAEICKQVAAADP